MAVVTNGRPSDEVRAALFEKLTERLRALGYIYPKAAAVVVASRGDARLSVEELAKDLEVDEAWIRAAEAGDVPLHEVLAVVNRGSN